jgi:hypothetical protein
MHHRHVAGVLAPAFLLSAWVVAPTTAGADPALGGEGSAFGITATLAGEPLLEPTPAASATAPPFPGEDSQETLIPIDADPLAVNATLNAAVALHQDANIASALEVEEQSVAGPYNAASVGSAEDLEVLVDAVGDDIPLVEADVLRGEVVAKCVGDQVQYSAQSEAVNLVVGGDSSLGDLANDLIDELFPGLDPLDPIVNLEETVITELEDGLAVDALVITLLEAADAEVGLAQIRIGHAELSGVACGTAGPPPECSDTTDNDGDGVIDADDPGCHSDGDPDNPDTYDPNDDDESDGGDAPECSDTTDNDGDGVSDADDPGCHVDGDADNPDSYDPNDDNEGDEIVQDAGALPATGAAVPVGLALGLLVAAGATEALRRRAMA